MAESTSSNEKINNIEEDNSVTMLDVLQEEKELEDDANAVLGASDDKNCTYSKGYLRQALYACKTCCFGDKIQAGVCLACSFHCHEGHELIELYTKRSFRCDCGNSKFGNKKCILDKAKASLNTDNKYNQNFDGLYCTCSRPYPDPESPEEIINDQMIQCIICEDWYHSKHLNCNDDIPDDESYEELICSGCMIKHSFLWRYAKNYSANKSIKNTYDNKLNSNDNADETVDILNDTIGCKMPEMIIKNPDSSCFWISNWRSSLCRCDDCKKLYENEKIEFLIDINDSVQAYEEAGKLQRSESGYEKGMKALASLGHVEQVNAIEEYNKMKNQLKEYLQKFAENKKVVREEDIKEFFSGMESNKRQKVIVPTFCR